jgi:ketosteroid isomerase-like protein
MMGRTEIDHLMREFYAARVGGDLEAVCQPISAHARFQITSANKASPVAIQATGVGEFQPLLALLLKTFRLSDFAILTLTIDGARITVHWRADVRSRITGATVRTEFIDLVEVREGCIVDFNEVFVQR